MKKILVLCAALAMLALTASAADVSGKWSGTFIMEGSDTQPALLVLKQAGTSISGTAGPNEGQQWAVKKGSIEGDKVTLEVESPENGVVYKLELVADGDHLKGDLTASLGAQTMKAKMDLTRSK